MSEDREPFQPPERNRFSWAIAVCVIIVALILAGATLGAIALTRSSNSASSQPVKAPSIVNNNNNTNKNSNKQSQTQGSGGSSGQSQSQSQATVVPVGQPFSQNGQQQQRVKIIINNTTTNGTKVFYGGGYYILTGPSTYIGTRRPPGMPKAQPISTTNPCHVAHPLPGCGSAQGQPPGAGSGGTTAPPTTPTPKMCAGRLCCATSPAGCPTPPPTNAPTTPSPAPPTTPSPTPPTTSKNCGLPIPNGYLTLSELEASMTCAQTSDISNSGAFDYGNPATGQTVAPTTKVTCVQEGAGPAVHAYSCSATDSVGDIGEQDTVTTYPNGTWAETNGMVWTGPHVTAGTYDAPVGSG